MLKYTKNIQIVILQKALIILNVLDVPNIFVFLMSNIEYNIMDVKKDISG